MICNYVFILFIGANTKLYVYNSAIVKGSKKELTNFLEIRDGGFVYLDIDRVSDARVSYSDLPDHSEINLEHAIIAGGTLRSDALSFNQGWTSLVISDGGKMYIRSLVHEDFAVVIDSIDIEG